MRPTNTTPSKQLVFNSNSPTTPRTCQITFGNEQNREHIADADNGERSVTAGVDGPPPSAGMMSMSILEDEVRVGVCVCVCDL